MKDSTNSNQDNHLVNATPNTNQELSQAGTVITGDQLSALLQSMKEGSGVKDRIEFTPTITINTLEAFVQRVLSTESLKKIQFGIINVVSESKSEQISSLSRQGQAPGEHWVSYIQVPNLFDREGNVISVRSIILNSAGESYGTILDEIKSKIEGIFEQNNIQITLPIKHLDYQKRDLEQHQDWNTCGVWACNFFEHTIAKIAKTKNPSEVKFEEITEYVNIAQKRQEYSSLLKALDISTGSNTKIDLASSVDKILNMESTETDSMFEGIDTELLENYGINTEEIDLDQLLNNESFKKETSAENTLSLVLDSLEAKELI